MSFNSLSVSLLKVILEWRELHTSNEALSDLESSLVFLRYLNRGGSIFFFCLGPRIVFPLPKGPRKIFLAVFLKTNSQFTLSLTVLIHK
jgi:hypothetical protein